MKLRKDRILGVDPGTNILGFGIIEIRDKQPIVLDANIINLKAEEDQQSKLKEIFLQIQEIIEAYSTGILAIEAPFYGKNPQSMLKLGRAQGVSIAAAMVMGLDIQEFSPKKLKNQSQAMVMPQKSRSTQCSNPHLTINSKLSS